MSRQILNGKTRHKICMDMVTNHTKSPNVDFFEFNRLMGLAIGVIVNFTKISKIILYRKMIILQFLGHFLHIFSYFCYKMFRKMPF